MKISHETNAADLSVRHFVCAPLFFRRAFFGTTDQTTAVNQTITPPILLTIGWQLQI